MHYSRPNLRRAAHDSIRHMTEAEWTQRAKSAEVSPSVLRVWFERFANLHPRRMLGI